MYFKQIYVKIVKTAFEKVFAIATAYWYGFNRHTTVSVLDKFYEKSPSFGAVAVFVAEIRIFEITAGT